MANKQAGFDIHALSKSEVNTRMAKDICIVTRDAYDSRFPDANISEIEATLKADPNNSEHVSSTLANLNKGPEVDWYWSVATKGPFRKVGEVATVVGFGLCLVQDERRVLLWDLHVHPEAQRKGVGRALARISIENAVESLDEIVDDPQVILNVAQYKSEDKSDPERLYKKLGFVKQGKSGTLEFGKNFSRSMYRMSVPSSKVLKKLRK